MIEIIKNTNDVDSYQLKVLCAEGKSFDIMFAGNFDLYWLISDKTYKDEKTKISNFFIPRSDEQTIKSFDKLFKRFDAIRPIPCCRNVLNANDKILWVSDDGPVGETNELEISKSNLGYKITFYQKEELSRLCAIRFSTSGSRNEKGAFAFMEMYECFNDKCKKNIENGSLDSIFEP